MEECVSSLMEGRSWRSTHSLFVVHEVVLAYYRFNRHQVLMNCNSSSFLSPTPCCIEQYYWDACWSWLGARPRTALWQTGGNGTPAIQSAVGRAVGRTAHTGGAGLWDRRQAHGVLAVTGSIPLGGSPRLLSVTRALLPKRVFYLEGGGRKPGQWERARARVRQTWGFFMGVYSGTRRTGEGCGPFREKPAGFPLTVCLFVCCFAVFPTQLMDCIG